MAVGLVVPDVAIAFYAAALKAAQEVLEEAGYHVLVMNSERAPERERAGGHHAASPSRRRADPGHLGCARGSRGARGLLRQRPLGIGAGGVAMDNEQGVRLLVEHLVDVHHRRRIAYVGPPDAARTAPRPSSSPRESAWTASAPRSGERAWRCRRNTSARATRRAPKTSRGPSRASCSRSIARPTPSWPGADTLAVGALKGARDRHSRVPEDVAIVCFDEPKYADVLDPPMTSLDPHDAELGRRAAELLLAALRPENGAPAPAPPVVRVPLELRVRRSCGCAAGAS
jgi:DNA-binding LacI/PurR family transcriptional regulator